MLRVFTDVGHSLNMLSQWKLRAQFSEMCFFLTMCAGVIPLTGAPKNESCFHIVCVEFSPNFLYDFLNSAIQGRKNTGRFGLKRRVLALKID